MKSDFSFPRVHFVNVNVNPGFRPGSQFCDVFLRGERRTSGEAPSQRVTIFVVCITDEEVIVNDVKVSWTKNSEPMRAEQTRQKPGARS